LLSVLQGEELRRAIDSVPGYDTATTGRDKKLNLS